MNSFPRLAPFGIVITTYELDQDSNKYNPILSHVFWGQNFEQALSYAGSHLVTDVFYSSSFIGELPWRNSVLILANNGQYIGSSPAPNIQETMNDLAQKARNAYSAQRETNVIQTIHMLSQT